MTACYYDCLYTVNYKGEHEYVMKNKNNEQLISRYDMFSQTIKTGIITSNLIPMFAGLTLSMYTYQVGIFEKWLETILALIGSSLVIAAAGSFNNLYERDIDAIMERTKKRPTVTGEINPYFVMSMATIMAVVGIIALWFTTPTAAYLGFLGLFFYVFPYTIWSKRFTYLNTEIGSISGAMPPLIGWAAINENILHPAIIGLFLITIFWQMPHFYAIALRKQKDYTAAKIPMLPVAKGVKRTYIQTNIYLIILITASFLFNPVSFGLTLMAFTLSLGWLILNIYGYKKMETQKWATMLFIYSLIHMTVLFSTVIIYSLVSIIFKLY